MALHILGGTAFEWDPETMTLPESQKTVAKVDTYGGSAIFTWGDLLVGTEIVMKWGIMSLTQYNALRVLYLNNSEQLWETGNASSDSYNVIVTYLTGELRETQLYDLDYRMNVEMRLNIRSQV